MERTSTHTYATGLIVVGLLAFMASLVWESGFVHGFFQGAAVALMVFGAYLYGTARRSKGTPEEMWRPSDGASADE